MCCKAAGIWWLEPACPKQGGILRDMPQVCDPRKLLPVSRIPRMIHEVEPTLQQGE